MNKLPLVIYHGPGCTDGMAAAWCMWCLFGTDAEYQVGRYQSDDRIDFADRDVYMVDFCYPLAQMKDILDVANKVVVIDHHAKSLDDISSLEGHEKLDTSFSCTFKSGARLAWEYITKRCNLSEISVPPVLLAIEDYDLWKFQIEDSKAIVTALNSHSLTFRSIDSFMKCEGEELVELVNEGNSLLRAHYKECKEAIRATCREMLIQDSPTTSRTIFVVNTSPRYCNDVGNMIAVEHDVGATYYDTRDYRKFSLRSNGKVDVAKIAALYGGGGHPNAAAFKVSRKHALSLS